MMHMENRKYQVRFEEIKDRKLIVWGAGQLMRSCMDKLSPRLNIVCVCDTFRAGEDVCGIVYVTPEDALSKAEAVVIAIRNEKEFGDVAEKLEQVGMPYCHIDEAVWWSMPEWDRLQLEKVQNTGEICYASDKIVKYISLHVPYKNCNFKCSYCYIGQHRNFSQEEKHFHSPQFIRKALSKERLGGVCLLNFCAGGETMMCRELFPILEELYREGHYVQIVTNGTVSKAFDEMIRRLGNLERVFFKFSFHYLELKKRNLLETYYGNIRKVKAAGASYTVELVPSDDLIPYIDEIKESTVRNLGALPHLAVPRDDTAKNLKILTQLSLDEYKDVWGQFDSALFDFKLDIVYVKRLEDCMAGEWAFWMDLETGEAYKCLSNPYLCNIYDDISKPICTEKVGRNCSLPYCYNGHAYLPLGVIREFEAPTYYDVRDRETANGEHWITPKIKSIFEQRLYLNN